MTGPTFEALYYGDRLRVVNPAGDVGLVTLWTPERTAERLLADISPTLLDPEASRVAVVSNLYGDGMYAMFCNLLWNPQVRHLVAIGEDLGLATAAEIEAFLAEGCEDTELLGRRLRRIRGTERLFPADPAFDEARLRRTLTFRSFGRFSTPGVGREVLAHLEQLPAVAAEPLPERVRVHIDMAVPENYTYLPSQVGAHQVVRRRPLDCWEELVVRVLRFGRPVTLHDGPRLELLNAKVVITEPGEDPPEALADHGFSLDRFRDYQRAILDPALPTGVSYSYGNRLRGYFGPDGGEDTLARAIALLREDPESRRAYVSLWDTGHDLGGWPGTTEGSTPCLTTVWFRRTAEGLSLSATYRSHNLLSAWLQNVYGLMAVQRHVAEALGMPVGPLTVVSHSLGADPRSPRYATARHFTDRWDRDEDLDRTTGRHPLREDPHGYFVVTVDEQAGEIVAEHRLEGLLLKEYRSSSAVRIEQAVAADMAVSLVSHALWLGRELTTKENLLRQRRSRREGPTAASRPGGAR